MPLKFQPAPGTIVYCDFSGLKAPEMTKPRPVIVLSPKTQQMNHTTVIVACLSTTSPKPICKYHLQLTLPGDSIPQTLERQCWLKGDMVYAFSLNRLNLYHFERDKESGKRAYYTDRFTGKSLFEIRKAVAHAIGFHIS